MSQQPRGRLLALLTKLQAHANSILLPGDQTKFRFKYASRRYKEMQGIINALNKEYGVDSGAAYKIDISKIERYGRNLASLSAYLDTVINTIAATYSSGSTASSASSASSVSSASSQSTTKQRSTSSKSSASSKSR